MGYSGQTGWVSLCCFPTCCFLLHAWSHCASSFFLMLPHSLGSEDTHLLWFSFWPFWWLYPKLLYELLSIYLKSYMSDFFQRPFLFLFYPPFDGFSQHLMVMILTFMYTVDLFPEIQVQMSNVYSISLPRCFTDTLNWKYPNSTESFLSSNWSSS